MNYKSIFLVVWIIVPNLFVPSNILKLDMGRYFDLKFDFIEPEKSIGMQVLSYSEAERLTHRKVSSEQIPRGEIFYLEGGGVLRCRREFHLQGPYIESVYFKNSGDFELFREFGRVNGRIEYDEDIIISFEIPEDGVNSLLGKLNTKEFIHHEVGLFYVFQDGRVLIHEVGIHGALYRSIGDFLSIFSIVLDPNSVEDNNLIQSLYSAF